MSERNLCLLSKACAIPQCGTFECTLRDRHPGLHKFAITGKRNRPECPLPNPVPIANDAPDDEEEFTAAQQLKRMCQDRSTPKGHPLQQVIIRIERDGSAIMPAETITSLRVKCKWSAEETGGSAGWYKGTITHISEDNTQVFVVYDDGDKYWEPLTKIHFL